MEDNHTYVIEMTPNEVETLFKAIGESIPENVDSSDVSDAIGTLMRVIKEWN